MKKLTGYPTTGKLLPRRWQLGIGDCEDLAILLVSLLRAYGVPESQVFVAVGNDLNDNWHAYLIEMYYYGVWRILDAEYARNAYFLETFGSETYKTSYCFNDRQSFPGLPVYPPGYSVSEIPVTTGVSPINTTITLTGVPNPNVTQSGIALRNPSFDEIKKALGKLWIPTYLPDGYKLSSTALMKNGEASLTYERPGSPGMTIFEYPGGGYREFPDDMVQEVTVRGEKAYLIRGSRMLQGSPSNRTWVWNKNIDLNLYFSLDGWTISIRGIWADAHNAEELIKIAESLQPY